MLLSDREIKELCIVPKFVVTNRIGVNDNTLCYRYKDIESFSYSSEEELITRLYISKNMPAGMIAYRSLTDEEKANFKPMISPYSDKQNRVDENGNKIISWGQSSSGYDLRIAPEFMVFNNLYSTIIDPKNFDKRSFVEVNADHVIIPPNSFVLSRSLERFAMPRDVCGIVVGKSTLARVGINCICTPLENSWEGYLTLEFANVTSSPVKLYANEGGCQVMFMRNAVPPDVSYSDRNGKYDQQQAEITLPRV